MYVCIGRVGGRRLLSGLYTACEGETAILFKWSCLISKNNCTLFHTPKYIYNTSDNVELVHYTRTTLLSLNAVKYCMYREYTQYRIC